MKSRRWQDGEYRQRDRPLVNHADDFDTIGGGNGRGVAGDSGSRADGRPPCDALHINIGDPLHGRLMRNVGYLFCLMVAC